MQPENISYGLLLILLPLILPGQSTDLRNDEIFFQQQQSVYQEWLDYAGLGKALAVNNLQVDSRLLTVTLKFNYYAPDSTISAWNQLRKDFGKISSLAMEERLFFKLATIMEVPFDQLELHIINYPSPGKLPVVDGTIFYDADRGKVGRRGVFRSEVRDTVLIPAFRLKESSTQELPVVSNAELEQRERSALNNRLLTQLLRHYAGKTDEKFITAINKNPVIVEVMNVKSEVIPAGWLSFTDPNEYLMITIDHAVTQEGLTFYCTIDGKFGNGLFRPRVVDGFRDMSPQYEKELSRYVQNFANFKLEEWIEDFLNN